MAPHDLDDDDAVLDAVRFGVRTREDAGRFFDGSQVAEGARDEGDVVVDRLRDADDGERG